MIPGSALRKLEQITGLKATKEADGLFKLEISPSVAYFSFLKDEKKACLALEQDNWRRVSREVMETQGWKCVQCGSREGLSCHHLIFRSRWRFSIHGPRDVSSNLHALCCNCHNAAHGIGV